MIDLLPNDAVQKLKNSLSEKRYTHCIGVMETAFKIAESFNGKQIDRTSLAWAGLFHDCAKELPRDEQHRLLNKYEISVGTELMSTPSLVHAPMGAILLQDEYEIDQPDILEAVAYHPTGRPGMGIIGMIIYMADYLEPGRFYFNEREFLLEAVLKNPLDGLRQVTNFRIRTVQEMKKPMNNTVLEFQQYLKTIDTL